MREAADMIGAVIAIRPLAQALSAVLLLLRPRRGGWSTGVVRGVTLLLLISIVVSLAQSGDASAQSSTPASPTPATSTPTPRATQATSRVAAVGGFVSGTVWDDSKIRNGQIDDNEPGIDGVTIVVERVDVPSGPIACTTGTGNNINPTDTNGRYRCEGLVDGVYRVTVTIPNDNEATTPRQRQVSVTATDGGRADFGLAHLDSRIRTIGGLVFLDCNENGIQDLAVEFDSRPNNGSFEVTLERLDGSNRQTSSTRNNGRYNFDNLDSGTYVVSLRISSSNFKATTSTRREVTIGTTFGAVADFGLVDNTSNSTCTRALNATATAVLQTATAIATRQGTPGTSSSSGSSGSGSSGGQNLPPATGTAVAQAATATARLFTPTPTLTLTPTPTPIPQLRMQNAYPRTAHFLMQAIARFPDGRRVDMLAEGALIGLETIVFQDAGQRVGSEQMSMRIKRNEQVDDVVVTANDAYRQRSTDDDWRKVSYDEVRNELGLLVPLDALIALRCVARAQEGGQAIVDGAVTSYILGEVDALRFWETSIRPHYGGSGSGALQGPTISSGARLGPNGRVIPSCTPPANAPESVSQNGAQPVYQTMKVETWVGLDDGLIRSERMTARVLPPISDPKRMPDPIDFDAVFTYSEVNQPITIIPPPLPEPTATPAPVAAPQPSGAGQSGLTAGPAGATPVQPAPPNGAAAPSAPTPGLGEAPPSGPFGTPEEVPTETTAGPPPSQQEQSLAAERALVAIATGGQPRTGSFALGNNILLDVPFRTQQSGSAYAPTNSGPASEAMVFAGYGTEVAVNDLRALLNGLDGNYNQGVGSRIETIAKAAERGGFNVLDLYRGARFNDWSVEQVREMIRRGYPLVTLVQGAVLPGGTPSGVARERFITIIGIDGDDIIYHDPAYPDEGTGAAHRVPGRLLEQSWLATSTPRIAAAFSQGAEGRGLLDSARGQAPPGSPSAASPTPALNATVPVVGTIIPTPTVTEPEYPFGLPVSPILVVFWLILVILLVIILIRSLR